MVENNIDRPISKIDSILIDVRKFFIHSERVLFNFDKSRILGKIWMVIDEFCPEINSPSITVPVLSETLVKLGLVSEKAELEILGRAERKRQRKGQLNEPQNEITFNRTGKSKNNNGIDEITILKTFVSEELSTSNSRIDRIIVEKLSLKIVDGVIEVTMYVKTENQHMHFNDEIWIKKPGQNEADYEWKKVEVTARDLNRTLALIAEGLCPGILGIQRLF